MNKSILVAQVGEIADGEAKVIPTDQSGADVPIAIFHSGGAYYALDDICTHEVASLADGWIEEGEVECPLHSARFCLRTGAALCLPAVRPVRTHRVQVKGDGLWLIIGTPALPHESVDG